MSGSYRASLLLAMGFAIGWTGCNAILGNGYGQASDERGPGDAAIDGPADATLPSDAGSHADALEHADAQSDGPADATSSDGPSADTSPTDAPTDTLTTDTSSADTAIADSTPPDAPSLPDAAIDGGCPTDTCVMATGLNQPLFMTTDGVNIYWTEFGDAVGAANGSVKSCPVSGCGAGPNVIASGLANPRGIAVDASNVYFATADYAPAVGGIWSCPLAGCGAAGPTMLAAARVPFGIAVDQSDVYWADNLIDTVNRVQKDGGGFDGGPLEVAPVPDSFTPVGCAVDATEIYVADGYQNVYRLPLGGGALSLLAPGAGSGLEPIAIDQDNVYYVSGYQIRRAAKSATDGGAVIAGGINQLAWLAVDSDAGYVYWANTGSIAGNDGTIGKALTDGGGQVNLGTALAAPAAITVSGGYVFWLSSGAIMTNGLTVPSTGTLTRQAK